MSNLSCRRRDGRSLTTYKTKAHGSGERLITWIAPSKRLWRGSDRSAIPGVYVSFRQMRKKVLQPEVVLK